MKSSHNVDFDLTDPLNLSSPNDARVYHDPHEKEFLFNPELHCKLHDLNLVTDCDKVLCTLKEFNDYRAYIARVKARMQLKKERIVSKLCWSWL